MVMLKALIISALRTSAAADDESLSLLQVAARVQPVSTLEEEATVSEWANQLEALQRTRTHGKAHAKDSWPWPFRREHAEASNETKAADAVEEKRLKATATKAKTEHKTAAKHSSDAFNFDENLGGDEITEDEALKALDTMLRDGTDWLTSVEMQQQDKSEKSHHHRHHSDATPVLASAEGNSTPTQSAEPTQSSDDELVAAVTELANAAAAKEDVPAAADDLVAAVASVAAEAESVARPPAAEALAEAEPPATAELAAEAPSVVPLEPPATSKVQPLPGLLRPLEAAPASQPDQQLPDAPNGPMEQLPDAPSGPMERAVLEVTGGRLSQAGYKKIADLHNTTLMAAYIRLAVAANGGVVTDEHGLMGFAPYHSGELGVQSYPRMLIALRNEPWTTVGKAGAEVPLDQEGYQSIADAKDTEKMASFITRLVRLYGGALGPMGDKKVHWFSKYHSGEKSSQNFKQLIIQLRKQDWVSGIEKEEKGHDDVSP